MEEKKIKSFLQRAKRRIWANLFLHSFFIYLGAGLLCGTFINVIALIFPIYHAVYFAAFATAVVTLAGVIIMLFRAPNTKKTALIVDKTGLQEQLVTSLELEGKTDNMSVLQKQHTCKSIDAYPIKEKLPIRGSVTNLILVCLAAMAFVVGAIMPSPSKQQAVAMHNLKEQAKKEAKKIEEVKKELRENEKVSKADMDEYEKLLKEGLEELKKTENKSDVKKAKERLETKLEKKLSEDQSKAAREIEKVLEKKKLIEKTAEEKDQEKTREQLKQELAKLEKTLSESEKNKDMDGGDSSGKQGDKSGEKSSDANSKNGEQNSSSQEDMLSLTQEMANAVENNGISAEDMKSLLTSLQLANSSTSDSNGANLMQQLSNQMSSMLSGNTGNQAMVSNQATVSSGNGNQGNQGMPGNGNSGGNGTGNGNGNGNGTGKGNGTGGGGGIGGGYNYGSKNGMERELDLTNSEENVTISDSAVGNDSNLTGNKSGNNQYTQKTSNGLTWAGNSVNYNQVVGNYANQAYSQLENSKIPDYMKDVVKSYFEGLTQ